MVQPKSELFNKEFTDNAIYFKALSHPARLQILQFLAESKSCITGDVCISGDISAELPLSRSTVNQHLKILKTHGFIKGNITGTKVNYCLDPEKINIHKNQLTSYLDELKSCTDCSC